MSKKYGLAIGVNKYEPNFPNLKSPIEDVKSLSKVLKDPYIGEFESFDELRNPRSYQAREKIVSFFKKRKSSDILLLYFSGHGVRDNDGQLYFVFPDTKKDLLQANAINSNWLKNQILKTRAKTVILILDCCYSGAFDLGNKSATLNSPVAAGSYFEGGGGTGRIVLAASDSIEISWEGDQVIGNIHESLFTYFLVNGLESGLADLDGDGWITIDELFEYASDRVTESTSNQTPHKWVYKQSGDIRIARKPDIELVELPEDVMEGLRGSVLWIKLGAINELGRYLDSDNIGLSLNAKLKLEELVNDANAEISKEASHQLTLTRFNRPPSETDEPKYSNENSNVDYNYWIQVAAILVTLSVSGILAIALIGWLTNLIITLFSEETLLSSTEFYLWRWDYESIFLVSMWGPINFIILMRKSDMSLTPFYILEAYFEDYFSLNCIRTLKINLFSQPLIKNISILFRFYVTLVIYPIIVFPLNLILWWILIKIYLHNVELNWGGTYSQFRAFSTLFSFSTLTIILIIVWFSKSRIFNSSFTANLT